MGAEIGSLQEGRKLALNGAKMWLSNPLIASADRKSGLIRNAKNYLEDPTTGDWRDALWLVENKVKEMAEMNAGGRTENIQRLIDHISNEHSGIRNRAAYAVLAINRAFNVFATSPVSNFILSIGK